MNNVDLEAVRGVSGIYKITNLVNEHCYIGSAQDIGARWKQHLGQLRGNGYADKHLRHLQFGWNKYGEENFTFEVIAFCLVPKEDELAFQQELYVSETQLIATFAQLDRPFPAYNNKADARTMRGFRFSDEQTQKLSRIQRQCWASKKKPVEGIDPITGEVREYSTASDAVKDGFSQSRILEVCKGKFRVHGGLTWQFMRKADRDQFPIYTRKKTIYKTKPIEKIDPNTGEITEYISIREAERAGFDRRHIREVSGKPNRKHAGFLWNYL